MRKFKCTAIVTEWVGNDIIEKWNAEDVIIAEDFWNANNKFIDGIYNTYMTAGKEVDVDDVKATDIGAADVILSVRLEDYVKMGDTMTVGELCQYLDENFDQDSKIYLGDYSGMVARYGYIQEDRFEYENGEE